MKCAAAAEAVGRPAVALRVSLLLVMRLIRLFVIASTLLVIGR